MRDNKLIRSFTIAISLVASFLMGLSPQRVFGACASWEIAETVPGGDARPIIWGDGTCSKRFSWSKQRCTFTPYYFLGCDSSGQTYWGETWKDGTEYWILGWGPFCGSYGQPYDQIVQGNHALDCDPP